jgi:tRNA pseudouridine55 synthase
VSSADGVLLIDKPEGPSSRDVLDALEPRLGLGPLGHAGTLDPLATGLLVVLVGRARKLQEYFTGRAKRYRAVVRFGKTTASFDRETPEEDAPPPPEFTSEAREALLARFRGDLEQRPPAYSAVRIAGRRAHELAREGKGAEPPARRIHIAELRLLAVRGNDWEIDVACSAGTFIRSLARDLGVAVGSGAYLTSLRRTASGSASVADAAAPAAASSALVRPLAEALAAEPRFDVDELGIVQLRNGRPLPAPALAEEDRTAFAWYGGAPRCRLKRLAPPLVRADLFFDVP